MYFLKDENRKVLFGWNAKCGCATIKKLYYYLQNGILNNEVHQEWEYKMIDLQNIEDYTVILFVRNPYKRIVSGYLDKYNGENIIGNSTWKCLLPLTFENFVRELAYNHFKNIDFHHFVPQISLNWDEKIRHHKNLKIFDIEQIDYSFIEKKFDEKIPDFFMSAIHKNTNKPCSKFDFPVYKATNDKIKGLKPDYHLFYNDELKNMVRQFYKVDFDFFTEKGLLYDITTV